MWDVEVEVCGHLTMLDWSRVWAGLGEDVAGQGEHSAALLVVALCFPSQYLAR